MAEGILTMLVGGVGLVRGDLPCELRDGPATEVVRHRGMWSGHSFLCWSCMFGFPVTCVSCV